MLDAIVLTTTTVQGGDAEVGPHLLGKGDDTGAMDITKTAKAVTVSTVETTILTIVER
jgi:hypothetical protein